MTNDIEQTEEDDSAITRLKSLFTNDDREEPCKHERENIFPDEDNALWYLLDKRTGREYWCERDAVYVKLRTTERDLICTGCGEERLIESAELIGGEEGLKRKAEMPEEELQEFRKTVHCGSYANGFPDHKPFSGDFQ